MVALQTIKSNQLEVNKVNMNGISSMMKVNKLDMTCGIQHIMQRSVTHM